ncbi:hypothetical protein D3C87_378940 [compost metagenome]
MANTRPDKISLMIRAVEEAGIGNLISEKHLKFDFRVGKNSLGQPICISKSELNLDKLSVEALAFVVGAIKNHRVAMLNLRSEGSQTNNIRIQQNLSPEFATDIDKQNQIRGYAVAMIEKALHAELRSLKEQSMKTTMGNPFGKTKPEKSSFFERMLGIKKEIRHSELLN